MSKAWFVAQLSRSSTSGSCHGVSLASRPAAALLLLCSCLQGLLLLAVTVVVIWNGLLVYVYVYLGVRSVKVCCSGGCCCCTAVQAGHADGPPLCCC
jgi:hypothetical protein